MNRYTLAEISALPVIRTGWDSDLVGEIPLRMRIWRSRLTKEDGMAYDNAVHVETYDGDRWNHTETYPAVCCAPCADGEHADDGSGQACPCCGKAAA